MFLSYTSNFNILPKKNRLKYVDVKQKSKPKHKHFKKKNCHVKQDHDYGSGKTNR